jgi:hypothetical protein
MKNTENAERPMSAIVYSPSRRGPFRWSGRPAQTLFSVQRSGTPGPSRSHRVKNRAAPQVLTVVKIRA